jgi:hypothetical protein
MMVATTTTTTVRAVFSGSTAVNTRGKRRAMASGVVTRASSSSMHDKDKDIIDRRSLIGGLSTTALAFMTTFGTTTGDGAWAAEDAEAKTKKVVAVPYTPYVVTSDSSEEALETAKQLNAAGARLYGAFWCENCNKQKELFGKQAMEMINYVECFPDGVYQNAEGHEDVIKPAGICTGYTSAWPLWVVPKGEDDEIGIQGQVKKPRELQRLIKEAKGEKFDALKYFTTLEME